MAIQRPTFSANWARVSHLTPTLRPHVRMTRQLFRHEPWYVVHDPISNQFFRLNPVAHHLVGLLDGHRSVDEAWMLTMDRYRDDAPTQNEVIHLLGQLNESNLLRVDLPADAGPLLERARRRKVQHWAGQAMSVLFVRFPLFNPNRMLTWLMPLCKPLLSGVGLTLWLMWMIYCGARFFPHLDTFVNNADNVLAPSNWGWMIFLFVLLKACHELGHGMVCKRLGGEVPEVGFMMLILMPAPYVDATSSWGFSNRWHRLLVSAAGMMIELALAGGAALIWLYENSHHPGSLTQQLSYNVVFLASVTTILFNANPLLRFDGYYMLADFLEVPNLYDRATQHLQWLIKRYAFGMENVPRISTAPGESGIFLIYGIASQVYRVFVLTGIILFIAGKLLTLGLLLAGWSLIAWVLIPLGKLIHWLVTGPDLNENRFRAIMVTLIFSLLLLGVLGAWPVDEHKRTQGIIQSEQRSDITVQTDGFVRKVLVESGQAVHRGQVLLIAENPQLLSQQAQLQAKRMQYVIQQRAALMNDPAGLRIAQAKTRAIDEQLEQLHDRIAQLVLRSPQDGTLIGPFMDQLVGQFLPRGKVIARVADLKKLHVVALVSQSQNAAAFFNSIRKVQLRVAGYLSTSLDSQLVKAFDAGTDQLPHPALSQRGGGQIAMAPDDPRQQRTLRPQFEMWLALNPASCHGLNIPFLPGQRVFVRFTLPRRPLLWQWFTRVRQLVTDRLQNNANS